MYCDKNFQFSELIEVIHNLCEDTKNELKLIFGNNWETEIIHFIRSSKKCYEKNIIKLKKNNKPVGIFGLNNQGQKIGGIFLLTCDTLKNGNLITFLKGAKKQIKVWQEKYKLILDSCHKENETIKKWLKLLGFKASEYQNYDFQVYYLGDIRLYKN